MIQLSIVKLIKVPYLNLIKWVLRLNEIIDPHANLRDTKHRLSSLYF